MLAHPLLPLLVFEHGFIQIRFGIFEFFCFCFMSNKCFLILLNFTRYLFSVNNFFIDEKHTQWMFRSSHQRRSVRKCVLGNPTKFTGKHPCQRLFFNNVAGLRPATLLKKRPWPQACNFIKKETLVQVLSCEFCEISKNTFFREHIWTTASECWILK